ncbi:class I SAM-dependent methyltransferase [Bradyrhizobium jicamae]|uniref:class I SAM-dependent methyltransferase n=1 Tax=Bradyrhizobium jicamae TaxID=280332 RepID=UPI001FD8D9D6|nr:class I SAM-dependent methyltransferase [Bradyrhizobium jicamae]
MKPLSSPRGAEVTGIDKSGALLAIARNRLGPDVRLDQAELGARLTFEDGSFELVLASLVLHYLQDWRPTLTEFRRMLVPGGRLVMSTHHPVMDHLLDPGFELLRPTNSPTNGRRGAARSGRDIGIGPYMPWSP